MKRRNKLLWCVGGLLLMAIAGCVGCTMTGSKRSASEQQLPVLLRYESETAVRLEEGQAAVVENAESTHCLAELEAQPYELSQIIFSQEIPKRREVLFWDRNRQLLGTEVWEEAEKSFQITPEIGFVSVVMEDGELEQFGARGILSEAGREDRKKTMVVNKKFNGKYLSVLGDSLSACDGYIPDGFFPQYPSGDVGVRDMWWFRLSRKLGMNLCRINACAGSGVTEYAWASRSNPETQGSTDRGTQLHSYTSVPDVIIVWLGGNDAFGEAPEDILWMQYRKMLGDIQESYPRAELYLCTYFANLKESSELNPQLRQLAAEFGGQVIEVESCGITTKNQERYMQSDLLHPNREGFQLVSAWMTEELLNE